jgi:hypothetical protein
MHNQPTQEETRDRVGQLVAAMNFNCLVIPPPWIAACGMYEVLFDFGWRSLVLSLR